MIAMTTGLRSSATVLNCIISRILPLLMEVHGVHPEVMKTVFTDLFRVREIATAALRRLILKNLAET